MYDVVFVIGNVEKTDVDMTSRCSRYFLELAYKADSSAY